MTTEDLVRSAIDKFDGRHTEPLEEAVPALAAEPALDLLLELASGEPREQQAATWLMLAIIREGHRPGARETDRLLELFGYLDHWEARLHVCQIIPFLTIPASTSSRLFDALATAAGSDRPFLRAWAYSAIHAVASQHQSLRAEADPLLDTAFARDESPAVRARIRKLRRPSAP